MYLEVTVSGKGKMFFKLNTVRSPRTLRKFLIHLPCSSVLYESSPLLFCEMDLSIAPEKAVNEVRKGYFGYWPMNKALFIAKNNGSVNFPLNVLGHIEKGVNVLNKLSKYDVVHLKTTNRIF